MYPMYRMKQNKTDGTEFCLDDESIKKVINAKTEIGHCTCDYCGKEILAVWDEHNSDKWFPYLGTQAKRPNTYKYSPIIQSMKKKDGCENKVWNNNLLNVHARIHHKSYYKRCQEGSIKLLCNDCFQKTYNRYQVELENGDMIALSVVEDRGETIESVMNELGLHGTVIGKGGKF